MEADLDVALELADPRLGRVALGRREERALRDAPELRLDLGGAVGGTRGDRSRRRRAERGEIDRDSETAGSLVPRDASS